MFEVLGPVIFALIGYVLIGLFVWLGVYFRFKLGSVLGVVLYSLPMAYLFFILQEGSMGLIVALPILVVSPAAIVVIVILAYAGSQLKDKQTNTGKIIIGVILALWTAMMLLIGLASVQGI